MLFSWPVFMKVLFCLVLSPKNMKQLQLKLACRARFGRSVFGSVHFLVDLSG